MIKMLLRTGVFALCAWAMPLPAQQPAPAPKTVDADPALWVVKDDDTTIYLFGTIHLLKPGLSWFDEAVKTAFDRSDELVQEIVLPDSQTVQRALVATAINPTGPGLEEKLPADTRTAYRAALAELGIAPANFDRFDPWFVATNLSVLKLVKDGYDPNNGAEQALTTAAKQAGKPVIGLETIEQQFGYFDGLSEKSQIAFLTDTLEHLPEAKQEVDKMVSQWSAGDTDGLAETLNEGLEATPEIAKMLLTDRNIRWADWIAGRMAEPGTVFVAVGAGHLAGKDSVQAQLAKHQLKAERIDY
ncbi:TraB/GumN family protein [Sphingomonas sp. ac-8]|uniref:TraB/GumN family protein n=1 Tax=Sphingomonas sp. ac-8 TaxID=3242977 RepID=UPI003A80AF90